MCDSLCTFAYAAAAAAEARNLMNIKKKKEEELKKKERKKKGYVQRISAPSIADTAYDL